MMECMHAGRSQACISRWIYPKDEGKEEKEEEKDEEKSRR